MYVYKVEYEGVSKGLGDDCDETFWGSSNVVANNLDEALYKTKKECIHKNIVPVSVMIICHVDVS